MQKVLKHSKQRDAVLRILRSQKTHPTADLVYSEVRKEFPNVSLATVYRNLKLLEEMGEIIRLECVGGAERYDGNPKEHYHFICRKCSAIKDIKMPALLDFSGIVGEDESLMIEGHTLFFRGLCKNCM